MKSVTFVLALALCIALAAQAATNAAAAGATINTAGSAVATTNAEISIETSAADNFAKPTLAEIAAAIKGVEQSDDSKGYEQFADMMKWDLRSSRAIDDLFQQCRNYNAALAKKPETSSRKRMAEYFTKNNPMAKKTNARFTLCYPARVTVTKGGKAVLEDAETVYPLDSILMAAEAAFTKATASLMMDRFINWGGATRGTIFLIPDYATWLRVRKGAGNAGPVQTVVTEDERREFYVFANPAHRDLLDQAVGYAVAELVLKEYSTVASKQATLRSKLPLFFSCGFAAQVAGLKAVLAPDGPYQLKTYNAIPCTPATIAKLMAAARAGKAPTDQLPLEPNQIYRCGKLMSLSSYPNDNEKIYYAFRQSRALVDYLQKNGTLASIALAYNLAQGKAMDKSFDSNYVKLRILVNGKKGDSEEPSKKDRKNDKESRKETKNAKKATENDKVNKTLGAADTYTPDDVLKGFKELASRADSAVFMPLTVKPTASSR